MKFFQIFVVLALVISAVFGAPAAEEQEEGQESLRVKRGHGGGGGGGHGHGPGKGGGAAGPVYICGYVGKTEGSGYGGYGK